MELLVVFSYSAVLFGLFVAGFHSSPCRFTLFPSHQRSAGIDFVFLTVESMLLKQFCFFIFGCAGLSCCAGFSV